MAVAGFAKLCSAVAGWLWLVRNVGSGDRLTGRLWLAGGGRLGMGKWLDTMQGGCGWLWLCWLSQAAARGGVLLWGFPWLAEKRTQKADLYARR